MESVVSVGMPINAIPASSVKHQFLAIVTRSPHGCGASPYLVRPLCSIELYETTMSNTLLYPFETNLLDSSLGSIASCFKIKIKIIIHVSEIFIQYLR